MSLSFRDHQQITIAGACIVQGLVSHASCQSAITNDGHRFALTARELGRDGHAQSAAEMLVEECAVPKAS
jgi:hypothetical protein